MSDWGRSGDRSSHQRMQYRASFERLESRRLLCADPALVAAAYVPAEDRVDASDSPALAAARSAGALPPPDLEWTTGTRSVLYIRAAFADQPTTAPQTLAGAQEAF